jgi:hypothetical protein
MTDEQQGPFCQLCLQRGHSLIRCPLREGLMFLVCATANELIINNRRLMFDAGPRVYDAATSERTGENLEGIPKYKQ